jgi:hypothetical protein
VAFHFFLFAFAIRVLAHSTLTRSPSQSPHAQIHARLQKAQRLLKQSKQKDYYKVLGVSRDADAKTIKAAFRKAAKTAHPDKGGSEAKMASVNEAYEVLSDPGGSLPSFIHLFWFSFFWNRIGLIN